MAGPVRDPRLVDNSGKTTAAKALDIADSIRHARSHLQKSGLFQKSQQVVGQANVRSACESVAVKTESNATFKVHLSNSQNSLAAVGARFDNSNGKRPLVQSIAPGCLLDRWNQQHPESAVAPDDIIVSVNGVTGDAVAIVNEISRSTELTMVVQKTASASTAASCLPTNAERSQVENGLRKQDSTRSLEQPCWFEVVDEKGVSCRVLPDTNAPVLSHLAPGEHILTDFEAKRNGRRWAKISTEGLVRLETKSKSACLGDSVRALCALQVGDQNVPAGSFGSVVALGTDRDLGVNWHLPNLSSSAILGVVAVENVSCLGQAWIPLEQFTGSVLKSTLRAVEGPPPPPLSVSLDEGNFDLQKNMSGHIGEAFERRQIMQVGIAKVVANHQRAWQRFRSLRLSRSVLTDLEPQQSLRSEVLV